MGRKLADIRYGQKQIQPAPEKCKYPHAAGWVFGSILGGLELGFHGPLIGNRAEGGSGQPHKILAQCYISLLSRFWNWWLAQKFRLYIYNKVGRWQTSKKRQISNNGCWGNKLGRWQLCSAKWPPLLIVLCSVSLLSLASFLPVLSSFLL